MHQILHGMPSQIRTGTEDRRTTQLVSTQPLRRLGATDCLGSLEHPQDIGCQSKPHLHREGPWCSICQAQELPYPSD